MKRRSIIAFTLIFAFTLSTLLSACGKNEGETNTTAEQTQTSETSATTDKEEPIEFTMFVGSPEKPNDPNNKIEKLIEEKTGVSVKVDYLVGDLKTKIAVMVAGGDYPDLIDGREETSQLVNAGVAIPLEELIPQYAPNLEKVMKDMLKAEGVEQDINKYFSNKDGHIYAIAGLSTGEMVMPQFYWTAAFQIQKAVLKEFGYPKITTIDEYFDIIKKYKDKYPQIDGKETIGFEFVTDKSKVRCYNGMSILLSGFYNNGRVLVEPGDMTSENYTASLFQNKEMNKEFFQQFNKANQMGLIDKEAFVMNYDQYKAKLASGRVLGILDHVWQYNDVNDSLIKQNKAERTYISLPIVFEGVTEEHYIDPLRQRHVPNVMPTASLIISKSCKDPARVMKFFNTMLEEENTKLVNWGIKDEDYKLDDKGRYYRTPEQDSNALSEEWRLKNSGAGNGFGALSYFVVGGGTFADGNSVVPNTQPEIYFNRLSDLDKEILGAYNVKTFGEMFNRPDEVASPYYPCWNMNLETGSPEALAEAKIETAVDKYVSILTLAKPEEFEKEWSKFVETVDKANPKIIEDEINRQIKERMESIK